MKKINISLAAYVDTVFHPHRLRSERPRLEGRGLRHAQNLFGLLGFRDKCEVLEPEWLRTEIKNVITQILRIYDIPEFV